MPSWRGSTGRSRRWSGTRRRKFTARLSVFEGNKVEQFTFTDEDSVRRAERVIAETAAPPGERLAADARGVLTCTKVDRKQRRRNPEPPFITSTLQQDASRKLGFSAQKTMSVAQRLYEGIDTGEGSIGPDHLHANGLGHARGRRRERASQRHCRTLRRRERPQPAAAIPHPGTQRPGKRTKPSGRPRRPGLRIPSGRIWTGTNTGSTS